MKPVVLIFSIFLFTQCKNNEPPLPMEEELLIELLADMHYAKAASAVSRNVNQDSIRKVFEDQVLEIKQIDRKEYEEIKEYLDNNINAYYDLEQKVHKHLKSIQDEKK